MQAETQTWIKPTDSEETHTVKFACLFFFPPLFQSKPQTVKSQMNRGKCNELNRVAERDRKQLSMIHKQLVPVLGAGKGAV